MSFIEIFLIGVSLSMDAFAVALCKGLKMRRLSYKNAGIIALFFGGFQALMPWIGYIVGSQFEQHITMYDHWIAFALLLFIGGKMVLDTFKKEEETACDASCADDKMDYKELLLMAVATSIDALAMGIMFAIQHVAIYSGITIIGLTTAAISFVGVLIGHKFGDRFKDKAQLAGGVVLIVIGLKILIEHLTA